MKAHVINLDSRDDRWKSVQSQVASLQIDFVRVSAVDQHALRGDSLRFAPMGVVATWLSHQKASAKFLETEESYALILEDDFLLGPNYSLPSEDLLAELKVDFLQLGYLRVTRWESINVSAYNLRNRCLRFLGFLIRVSRVGRNFQRRKLLSELAGTPKNWVAADIRPGGQAYIVSRKFAHAMQVLNSPTCLSTDGFFEALGKSRTFNMFRLQTSCVGQSNSPSSVMERFIN